MIPVAGVDGCRSGWVIALLLPRGGVAFTVVDRLDAVIDDVTAGRLAALAVDIPVGLPDRGPRACDLEARRRLGPRRASVFPAPVRNVLAARDYSEALARSRAACGRGLSRQAFQLVRKIAEVDRAMTPALQHRVVEAHPEVAFTRLAGRPLLHPKRASAGRAERLALLAGAGLTGIPARLPGAAPDDVLDAAVLALVAARVRDGEAEHLGDGSRDRHGLRMEIVA